MRDLSPLVCLAMTASLVAACDRPSVTTEEPSVIRLVDLFPEAEVEGQQAVAATETPRTEWLFGDGSPAWSAAGPVVGVHVEGGALVGTTQGPNALLHTDWSPVPEQADDRIHSVEVRLRAAAAGRLSVATVTAEELETGPLMAPNPFAWSMTTPIVAAEEAVSYVLRPVRPLDAAGVHHLVLRPIDVPGAEFAIESVRVVFEREHLSSVPAGVNWQGLSGEFRESLVARAPETLHFDVELPARPVLDLGVGTLTDGAVTFDIRAEGPSGREVAVRRTVTTPRRWDDLRIPLDALAGEKVSLRLHVEAEEGGAIGVWGAPVVRERVDGLGDRPQAVIALLIDTLRRDHLGLYGHDRNTAPTLARLAAEGVLVEDPISQATWTKVSVPSIFTSLYPTTHTVENIPDLLPASADTMAEVFRRGGYATVGLSAIPFSGKMTNLHQGYEVFWERDPDLVAAGGLETKAGRVYVDTLLPWIEAHRDVPFFAFLHVEDPHSPYFAPQPYARLWGKPGDPERYRELQDEARPNIANPLMRQFGMASTEALEKAGVDPDAYVELELDAYDGLIRSIDEEISRLVERLDELGLRDRVLVAVISDHGTEFLEHGEHFHGQSVYGELNRVPMFFWGPGFVPAGVRVPGTVENVDYMPTVLDVAGLPIPAKAQGQSLVPWFGAGGDESVAAANGFRRKPAITEKAALQQLRGPEGYGSQSIIADGWKLIQNDETRLPGVPEYELYDYETDPLDQHDVAGDHPEIVERLAHQLDNWRQFAEKDRLKSDDQLAADMTPEQLERLRALGYL